MQMYKNKQTNDCSIGQLNVNEIALHAKSKRELYCLLQIEGSIYLLHKAKLIIDTLRTSFLGRRRLVDSADSILVYQDN